MASPFPNAFTQDHARLNDGSVGFECSDNVEIWPWLALNPIHPIVVQTITFWGSIESGMFLGTFDPSKRSALAQTDWTCGAPHVGPPARGTYAVDQSGDRNRFQLSYVDADDRLVAKISGQGVVFRTRNFEDWRGAAKEKIVKPVPPAFEYAPAASLGVTNSSEGFLSPLRQAETISAAGLITKANGLIPGHPYIGGSGDHVNSTHMGEIGRQFGDLLHGQPLINNGGEMEFLHYVELGTPFEVELIATSDANRTYELLVCQAGRDCAKIRMSYTIAD